MERGDKYWQCPFCNNESVKVFHRPAHREHKVSRGSGCSAGQDVMVPQSIEVMGNCEKCGAVKNKIQAVLDGKMSVEEALAEKKKCKFCKEPFEGPGSMCKQCAEWER